MGAHQIGLHHFSLDTVAWLDQALESGGGSSSALAREGWRNAKAQLRLGSGRQALPKWAVRLGRALPSAQPAPEWTAPATDYPNLELAVPLSELGAARLVPVCGREERAAWRSMLASYHPQGWAKVPDEQLR